MSKFSRRVNGTALAISTAVIVATAVNVEWPFLRVSTTQAGPHCSANNLTDCGIAATQRAYRLAQVALQAVMPSLRDERRLPSGPKGADPTVERTPDTGAHTARPQGPAAAADAEARKSPPSTTEDAEAQARELARQLARSIADSSQ